jgi:hypothetical protein
MEQMIVEEKAEALRQQQAASQSSRTAISSARVGILVEQEKGAQIAAISSALQQVRE